jgi:hypothetical protein
MRKGSDSDRPSGLRIPFVWDTSARDTPDNATAETSGAVPAQPRISRKRVLLIGSSALVVLCGAVYGVRALATTQHTDTVGAAAMTQPSPQLPKRIGATMPSARPSPRSSVSRSATPPATHSAAAAQQNTAAAPVANKAPAVVAAPPTVPAPAGNWLLNQTVGNTAVDSSGGHDGTAQDGWWAGGACLFNGTNSQIYTNGPVLSTGSGGSFTVSAWVDMTALPASGQYDETAVSQDGGVNSGFYLQYTEPADRWAFSRTAGDTDNPGAYRALSASGPALNTWTHLVGVYNAANNTQYLYVNGVAQGTATDPTPFAAPGDLAIGRAQYNGQETDWLKGAIKKVEVFGSALSAAQVSELS